MIENMTEENDINEFVIIKDFPNYKINKKGKILNKEGKELSTPLRGKNNYLCCHLYRDGKQYTQSIHRLLALHFIETTDINLVVDHIDRNKLNNDLTNLRWATFSENAKNSARCESKISYTNEYKNKWIKNKRANMSVEEKEQELEHNREIYAKRKITEEQRERAKERARKQREKTNADPEKLAQLKEYKKEKAKEYREQQKEYYNENKEKIKEKQKIRYALKKEQDKLI
jgi:hypothetical protein